MKRDNIVQEKSYAFALEILRIAKNLRAESTDRVLINQLVRSVVPVGANVEEAIGAQ
ncbi:four helix bundle protein [Roseivirga sp. UBA838]|uniref:four helix bundle protein n=1 Tax=Roseivirga sp. UBA838 TaxID=1947393 RepID=UPI00257AE932|nr:four helix bundle protein [Roseivirga sp. UBA838]|tara:strand:+ start:11523 stop:11693 length:171 start_codon:yes stop_codon:yes gene_type:complete